MPKVACHGNLNRHCLSLKQGSEPMRHIVDSVVVLRAATFRVQPKGHERIVSLGRRNVVARIHGTLDSVTAIDGDTFNTDAKYRRVSYNPASVAKGQGETPHPERPFFYTVDDGKPVESAAVVYLVTHSTIPTRTSTSAYIAT
jgi:hypothetical protein